MKTLISLDDVESFKHELIQILPDVKSSHRVEAMARGLGWGSNAALRTELAAGPLTRSPDNRAFSEYLKEHGFPTAKYDALEESVVRCKFAEARSAVEAIMTAEPNLSMNGYRTDEFGKSRQERQGVSGPTSTWSATWDSIASMALMRPRASSLARRPGARRSATSLYSPVDHVVEVARWHGGDRPDAGRQVRRQIALDFPRARNIMLAHRPASSS